MQRLSPLRGFSIAEVLVAILISSVVCIAIVQLFHQNERVFRDQSIVIEMQQSARAALALITDDIRLAGQGVPVFEAGNRDSISEGSVVVLNGTGPSRIQFRAGLSDLDSVVSSTPLSVSVGTTADLSVPHAAAYSAQLGTAPTARYVFIWGAGMGWVRGHIHSISGLSRILTITPVEASPGTITFSTSPMVSLEEAIAIFFDPQTKSVRRATATNLSNPAAPQWGPANELAAHVVELEFQYFDARDSRLPVLDTLTARDRVARIDVQVSVEAASPLNNGALPVYTLSQRSIPRNLALR
jgi:hypothetical protein